MAGYPARFLAGQLVWTTTGTVWALWRVEAKTYPFLATREKIELHDRTRAALMSLGTESMLLSVCEPIDPAGVVEAMVEGVDLDRHPAWVEVATEALDNLGDVELWRRSHWLAVQLPNRSTGGALKASLDAAKAQLGASFGLPPAPIRRQEVMDRQTQADQLSAKLAKFLGKDRVRPATAGELRWLYARAAARGIADLSYDDSWEPRLRSRGRGPDAVLRGPSLTPLGDAVFKEGGDSDDADRPNRHRRYLRVETEQGVAYQTFLVVADMPAVFTYPDGGEALHRADVMSFPVDWCARIRPIANADAQARTKRQARQLRGQFDEYDGETAGPPPTLAAAMEAIDDERAQLAANPAEPELETTFVFVVWARTLAELEGRADQLRSSYEANEYGLPRPTGGQLALFGAMLPGSPLPTVAKDYTQFSLVSAVSACAPWAGCEVGDPRGSLFAISLDGGTHAPVLFDAAYGPSINRSGSIGMFGALGGGKSYAIKRIAWDTLARGGQVVALDRTPMAEYVRFAEVVPGHAQVVQLGADADVCLDPLRAFPGEERIRYTIGFLTLLSGTSPLEVEGAILGDAVRAAAGREDACLAHVIDALGTEAARNPKAEDLYQRLANVARADLAHVAFGDRRPLRLDADYLVFHMPGLSLPDKEVVESRYLSRQMLPEQIISQALLYLVAAVARSVAFADRSRFAAVKLDEVWHLTANLQGRQLAKEMLKDGRKHNAAVWILSQQPSDLGAKEGGLVELLGTRMVFRQEDRSSAAAALEFLAMEPSESTLQLLTGPLEDGQCLLRDLRKRIGLVQVLPAPFPELHTAFDTTPDSGRADKDRPPGRIEEEADLFDELEEELGAAELSATAKAARWG
ncbi:MAG TPA: ATP-binding protein [Acidimicrobiales bacterium]|nr:ATP-binding protein [Acidimicrobiales bacterium]